MAKVIGFSIPVTLDTVEAGLAVSAKDSRVLVNGKKGSELGALRRSDMNLIDVAPVEGRDRDFPFTDVVPGNDTENADTYAEDQIAAFAGIVGRSSVLQDVLQQVEMVSGTDSTVLLLGETGTGKELIARAIHERSRRKSRALVKVNCAAIPGGLLESELFGHERGAFTGAITQKIGRFELADQGSLFLDEIGDIPLELQPKLLRVLQEREFERLGSTVTRNVNVRVVAATHQNLDEMIQEKRFRSDLYYRLNVFPIVIPALRERSEDVPLLVEHFVRQFALRMNKTVDSISAETMEALTQYSWPGNIRELQNVIERAVVIHVKGSLSAKQCCPLLFQKNSATRQPFRRPETEDREMIDAALVETRGRVSGPRGAAAMLGIPSSTLESKIRAMNIDKYIFKSNSQDSSRTSRIREEGGAGMTIERERFEALTNGKYIAFEKDSTRNTKTKEEQRHHGPNVSSGFRQRKQGL